LEAAKTKAVTAMVKGLGLEGKALVVVDQPSDALKRAARNHPHVEVLPLASLNLYDVLRHRYLITTQADLPRWSERWA